MRAEFMSSLKDQERTFVPKPSDPADDPIKLDCICSFVSLWPTRYFDRFKKWYLKRKEKFSYVKGKTFEDWAVVDYDDCFHHLKNWDNGLRKSLLKEEALKPTQNFVRRIYHKERKFKKVSEKYQPPHLNDLDYKSTLSFKFQKKAVVDPKTSQIRYVPVDDVGVEQIGETGQTAVDLEASADTTSTANITFVDERPKDSSSLHTKSETFSRDLHNDIAENDWSLTSVLTREYPITNFEWKVGDKIDTKIVDKGLPKILTDDGESLITRQLKVFAFLRAGVKIRVQLNSTKFHCGRLLVYFKPITWDDDLEENFYGLTCFPHFFLDASVSNSGELLIPFTHLLTYFSQASKTVYNDSINTLGSLCIRPYNPLQASENASQSVFGQVFVTLVDPYVHLPTSEIAAFSYGTGYMQSLESFLKRSAGNLINSGLGLADKFTGGLVTGAGDAVCNLLGICDKPIDPVSANPMINRTIAPLCHGAGLDRSTRLALSPISQTDTTPAVLGAVDSDFNLLTLCKMPCLLDQPVWDSTKKPGDKLFDMLVTPTYLSNPQYTADGSGRYTNYTPTMLAYVSRAFCYWRGTLKVKIQVVATQFHTGRLALVYDPHGNQNVNFTDFQKNKNHNMIIMDIQEQQELTVDLPYFAIKPWLRCDRFRADANLVPMSTVDNPGFLDCDVSGVFRIFVMNSLVRPDNVPDKIQINVFFYAGDNFELAVPNPVAPLSVRKGPSGVQYNNAPRYTWCSSGDAVKCSFYDVIMSMYRTGQRLFENGIIEAGSNWYQPKVKISNNDSLEYFYAGQKIAYYMEKATGPCADLIKNLPNFTTGGSGDAISRIDEKTTKILADTIQIDEKLKNVTSNVDFIRAIGVVTRDNTNNIVSDTYNIKKSVGEVDGKVDTALSNTRLTLAQVNALKTDTTQINNTVGNIDYNVSMVDQHVQQNGSALRQIPKADGKQWNQDGQFNSWGNFKFNLPESHRGEEQGLEDYTTTRESEGASVTITSGNKQTEIAPGTVSESAMNLQTVLRRYYPLWVSSDLHHSNNFTLVSIPVTPSFVPSDDYTTIVSGLNRRYEVNNLAWFSRLYTYFRGSLRYKILVNTDDADIYVWHNPVDTKGFNVTSGFDYDHITEQMNFATEAAVSRVQQGLEVEVPFYSSFNQLVHSHVTVKEDLRAQNGVLYIAVRNKVKDFNISVFISTGDDFFLNVLRAPPVVHEPAADGYVDSSTANKSKYPELQRAMMHTSTAVQIPGSAVFDRWKSGVYKNCTIPAFTADQDFSILELEQNSQQMDEQMFTTSKVIQDVTGISEFKNSYYADIKPTLQTVQHTAVNSDKLIQEMQSFLKEFKEDVLPAILGHAKLFHKDLNSSHETIKEFLPKIDEALSHVNAFMITSKSTAQQFGTALESWSMAGDYMGFTFRTIIIAGIWLNLVELKKKFSFINLLNVVCHLCALFRVQASQIIAWMYDNCRQMYEDARSKVPNEAMCEQGFNEFVAENSEELTLALAAVATVIYFALFGGLPSWKFIREAVRNTVESRGKEQGLTDALKNLHFSNLGFKAIMNAFDFFRDWIDKLLNYFLGKESQEILLEKEFKERTQEVLAWIDEIEELEDEDLYHLALSDVDCHNRFYKLVDKGKDFTKWLMTQGVSKNISNVIRDMNKRLHDMIKRLKEIQPGHGFRYSPFTIMLDGRSGVAKSNMMHRFTDMIRETLNIPYYNSVCTVPKTKQFLDGYEGQAIVEWDDMFQCPKQDEMVADFINWRSNADCIIDKAHVDQKGMHFTSKAIVMSSNNSDININTVRCMDALRNRINVKFDCTLAEGYTPQRLKEMPRDPTFSFVRMKMLEPNEDGSSFVTIAEDLTFAEAIELTRQKLLRWDAKQKELLEEYYSTHGSLRIPRGVQIEHEEVEETHEQIGNFLKCVVDEQNLTEEELVEAELFQFRFDEMMPHEQHSYYQLANIRIQKESVKAKVSRYYQNLRKSVQIGIKTFSDKVKDFYEKHPMLSKTIGLITTFTMVGVAVKMLWTQFAGLMEEESQYDVLSKTPSKIVRAETSYNSTSAKIPQKLVKAETSYVTSTSKVPQKLVKAESSPYAQTNLKIPSKLVRAEISEEGSDDIEAVNVSRNKVHPLVTLVGWEKEDYSGFLHCLAIGGKVILTPHHFFRRAKAGDFFFYMQGNEKVLIEFVPERLERIGEKDACLYFLGAQMDSRKNILNCFVKEQDLGRIGDKVQVILLGLTSHGVLLERQAIAKSNQRIEYSGKDEEAILYKQYGWSYPINTVNGDCGSPLIAVSKVLPPPAKIVGIHTAGYTNKTGGFAVLLTQEQIALALRSLTERCGQQVFSAPLPPQVIQDEQMFDEKVRVKPSGYFSFYGVMDPKFCPSQPTRTQYKPTPWQGELYPVVKAPAVLKPVDGVSPLANALNKYGKQTKPFSNRLIRIVRADILNDLVSLDGDLKAEPVSDDAAIFGIDGVPYCKKLNMKSSPGWPYQCLPSARGQYGKQYLFDIANRKIVDPLLQKNLIERESLAKEGCRYASIWRDCMKDELRPLSKIRDLKTRLFTIAPVDFTILVRKYFLAFEQVFYKNHSKFFSAVGINVESFEWTEAYNRLRAYGNLCVAGDFSSFDGTLMAQLMYETGEIIDDWYKLKGEQDPSASIVRRVLIDEMIHTYQLVHNCVYKTHQGNPSGNPLTVIINTIVNCFYMRLAWMEIMREMEPKLATMDAYHKHVIEEMYGDDNRLVVRKEVIDLYNQVTISECLRTHGIVYTDESKSSELVPFRDLDDTSFLKRSYRRDPEVGNEFMLPVIDQDTITSLTNWVRIGENELSLEQQIQEDQRNAFRFAFFHGRNFFKEFSLKFITVMRDHGIQPICITYDELLDQFIALAHGDAKGNYFDFLDMEFY